MGNNYIKNIKADLQRYVLYNYLVLRAFLRENHATYGGSKVI